MARITVTRICGHTDRIGVFGSADQRERTERYEASRQCADCYRASQASAQQAFEAREQLPELLGTPAQVEWAGRIRAKALQAIEAEIVRHLDEASEVVEAGEATPEQLAADEAHLARLRRALARQGKAIFWIERRDHSARALLSEISKVVAARDAAKAEASR